MRLVQLVVDGLLTDTVLLLPLVVFVGLLLARQPLREAAGQGLAALAAWVAVLVALALIAGALDPLMQLAGALFAPPAGAHRAALAPVADLGRAFASSQAWAVLLAYAVNVAWARLAPPRYLFLNPIHVLLGTHLGLAALASGDLNPWIAVGVTGVVIGSMMAWLPHLSAVTGTDDGKVGLASFSTGALIGVGQVAQRLGDSGSRPRGSGGGLEPVSFASLVVGGLAVLLAFNAGPKATENALEGLGLLAVVPAKGASFYLIGAALIGFVFAAGLWLLLQAAPALLQALSAAFSGVERLLPGARPALDALFLLPDDPRAAVQGFLLSLAGGMAGMYLLAAVGVEAVVPGMLVALSAGHFIQGGAAGVLAARRGRQRGLWLAAPLHGLVLSLLAALCALAIPGARSPAVELSDLSVLGSLLGLVARLFS